MIYSRITDFNTEEINNAIFLASLIGGQPWIQLSTVLKNLSAEVLSSVIDMLYPLLARKYSESIAAWICDNWTLIEEQSLKLIRYLAATQKDHEMNYKMLMISSIADIGAVDKFVLYTKMFLRFAKSQLIFEYITQPQRPLNSKLSFDHYIILAEELMKDVNKHFIEDHTDTLLETPID